MAAALLYIETRHAVFMLSIRNGHSILPKWIIYFYDISLTEMGLFRSELLLFSCNRRTTFVICHKLFEVNWLLRFVVICVIFKPLTNATR